MTSSEAHRDTQQIAVTSVAAVFVANRTDRISYLWVSCGRRAFGNWTVTNTDPRHFPPHIYSHYTEYYWKLCSSFVCLLFVPLLISFTSLLRPLYQSFQFFLSMYRCLPDAFLWSRRRYFCHLRYITDCYCYYYYHHHHLLYARYLYLYSWHKLCP